ncbi:hypothetical protein [Halobacillus massiliensis]|uniref:hypothetical protein n=1 Tax=Halobacillus massiliensis TaxID=1926286 RepID=UPI0015C45215|nr:hypothetical protein [Halobacillus massiliensis]
MMNKEPSNQKVIANITLSLLELKAENKAIIEFLINKGYFSLEELEAKKEDYFNNGVKTEIAKLFGMDEEEFNSYLNSDT